MWTWEAYDSYSLKGPREDHVSEYDALKHDDASSILIASYLEEVTTAQCLVYWKIITI